MYIRPLRANPTILGPDKDKLERFIDEVFHNYYELLEHHRRLCEAFHKIQREQHPVIRSITDPMMDAALNFREAYMEYIPNYPIAAYRIDDEMANNPAFKAFVEVSTRRPFCQKRQVDGPSSCIATSSAPRRPPLRYEELHQSTYPEAVALRIAFEGNHGRDGARPRRPRQYPERNRGNQSPGEGIRAWCSFGETKSRVVEV